jgi:hypothetical protein
MLTNRISASTVFRKRRMPITHPSWEIVKVCLSVCEDSSRGASFELDPSKVNTNLFADVCLVESVSKQEFEAMLSLERVTWISSSPP